MHEPSAKFPAAAMTLSTRSCSKRVAKQPTLELHQPRHTSGQATTPPNPPGISLDKTTTCPSDIFIYFCEINHRISRTQNWTRSSSSPLNSQHITATAFQNDALLHSGMQLLQLLVFVPIAQDLLTRFGFNRSSCCS